jgi:hypothetical protein
MTDALSALKRKIAEGIPWAAVFSFPNAGEILRQREHLVFSGEWMRTRRDLLHDPEGRPREVPEEAQVLDVGRTALKLATDAAPAVEFANLVCSDFDLIARALALNRSDPWLNALWLAYRSGHFPHGRLAPIDGDLSALVSQADLRLSPGLNQESRITNPTESNPLIPNS